MLPFSFRKEIMQYSIEDDGIYKVEIIRNIALKTFLVPKDIVLKAANAYETDSLMRNNPQHTRKEKD